MNSGGSSFKMIINCPHCKRENTFENSEIGIHGKEYRCDGCNGIYLIKRNILNGSSDTKSKILIAHSNGGLLDKLSQLLEKSGFDAIPAKDGLEALQLLEIKSPQMALLDVALPKCLGFEVCSFIKSIDTLKNIKVILLAAIYDKTRYKRAPTSLYGADDYIEIHHLWDMLIPKIVNHLNLEPSPHDLENSEQFSVMALNDPSSKQATRVELTQEEPEPERIKDEDEKTAKKLARIIVSDIILYNEEIIEEGIRNNNIFQLLDKEIVEGREYLLKRLPWVMDQEEDYILQVLEEFIEKRQGAHKTDYE